MKRKKKEKTLPIGEDIMGIAIGRNTHTMLWGAKDIKIANSTEGLKAINRRRPTKIIIAGNRKWALPLAYALFDTDREYEILYLALKSTGERGPVGPVGNQLRKLLLKRIYGKPFFQEYTGDGEPEIPLEDEEARSEQDRQAKLYLKASNEVRRLKHLILKSMALLFPEVIRVGSPKPGDPVVQPQPPDIFRKKMRVVLEDPFPERLTRGDHIPEPVRILARKSLARKIPIERRKLEADGLPDLLAHYDRWVKTKSEVVKALRLHYREHPAVKDDFGEGDLIVVLLALLAWKEDWRWREVRRFCGLDVSRIDGRGNDRISRRRGPLRQYIYLLGAMTGRGKAVARSIDHLLTGKYEAYEHVADLPDEEREAFIRAKMKRVKAIERILKYLWNNYLKKAALRR